MPLGVATIYLTYWLALLVLLSIENPLIPSMILVIIVGACAFVGIIFGFCHLSDKYELGKMDVAKPFKVIGRVTFIPIGRGIKAVCSFLWMNVVAFKENYCPQIEWKD